MLRSSLLVAVACQTTALFAAVPLPNPTGVYPAVATWARAGVTGGVPLHLPVVATLHPGADVQAAVDAAAARGGLIRLTEGDYPLREPLRLRTGVVLRGFDRVNTRLVLQLHGTKPAADRADDPAAWTCGVLLAGVERAGLEELTVMLDPTLLRPVNPNDTPGAYADNPDGRDNLHVVSVAFAGARDCWLVNSLILNSGSHPLFVADSRQVTVSEVVAEGAYNRGPGSGQVRVIRCEGTLVSGLRVKAINTFVLEGGPAGATCRGNVIESSRFEVDVRVHGRGTVDNLFENCAIAVPTWLARPPLSPGNAEAREAPPGPGNLLYLCTVTRAYGSGQRAFSLADDPNLVYEVLQTHARERAPSVVAFGPAPAAGSLRRGP